MSLFSAFNKLSHGLFQLLGGPIGSYCRLETADDPKTLVADDGSLIGAINVFGTLALVGQEELEAMAEILTEKTGALMERPGHSISMVFEYDPGAAQSEIEENLRPSRVTAAECSLALDKVLDGHVESLSRVSGSESLVIVLWTSPSLLSDLERKSAIKETLSSLHKPIKGRQSEGRGVGALRSAHHGAMELLLRALKSAGLMGEVMSAHDLVALIRKGLDPHMTNHDFKPLLPGDPRPFLEPDRGVEEMGFLLYPNLASQIFPSEAKVVDRSMILVGQRLHAPFLMSVP
ncbi:MAG: hypothetical protein LBE80_08245, partial [Deltaproteobacteria bacterium]|nr:hypothetical protein [Deltaproteobacteria bacterium]